MFFTHYLELYVHAQKCGIAAAFIIPDALEGWLHGYVVGDLQIISRLEHGFVIKV